VEKSRRAARSSNRTGAAAGRRAVWNRSQACA
jgi:hypothetical protein